MAVLNKTVALGDIRDAEAFVQATLNASRRVYGPDEREELIAEGLRIMVELHARFEPRRDGYEAEGRFSGFCAKYLRLKLEDAYHRLHPEHRLVTQPDGRRRYLYGEHAVSLEALVGDDSDREPALAGREADGSINYLPGALAARALREVDEAVKVARALARGMDTAPIAAKLGLEVTQVQRFERLIWRASAGTPFTSLGEVRERLEVQARADAAMAMRAAELFVDEPSESQVAETLGIELGELQDHRESIKRVTEMNR